MAHVHKYTGLDLDPRKVHESLTVKPNVHQEHTGLAESQTGFRYLLPRIEAIHAGSTRNSTRYPAEKLKGSPEIKSGVYSWLHPYPKPVIYNHDVNTEATGRVQSATFSEITSAGRPGIIVIPRISEAKAVQDVLDGRLLTVSIGATTDAAVCSVCGTDIIAEGFCGHMKGEEYDGVKAEWIVGNLWFDELSWVNVPADSDAMVTNTGSIVTAEAFANNGGQIIDLGKKTTEWLVAPEMALAEGLMTKEKGDSALLTAEEIKALQDKVTELEGQVEEANTAKAELETELTQTKEELETVKNELAEKTTELEEKDALVTEKEAEVAELTTAKESLESEKSNLEESIEQEKQERQSLLERNTELASEVHKSLAERVVDLKVVLGKEASREEAIETHLTRSTESLTDTLADLLKEDVTVKGPRVVEAATNPGVVINDGTVVTEGAATKTTKKDITTEDALMGLFGGPAFSKRK